MKGFFTREQTKSKSRPDGKTYSCASCGLYQYVLTPRMDSYGNFKKGILNIGEAPGEEEDKKGKQWQGKVGRRLKKVYRRFGIDLFDDCLNINAANCRPPKNRAPTDYEIACCRSQILKIIEQYQPRVIILLGGSAIKSLLGHRWKKNLHGISTWRGWTIPDRDFNAWICPIFHPSYVERQQESPEVETVWEQDLEQALSKADEPLPEFRDDRQNIEIIKDQENLEKVFNKLSLGWNGDLTFFDYETTGLKPHAKGHRIVCAAVATSQDHAYAFMMPTKKRERTFFARYLATESVGKGAANMKFEDAWSQVRLGCTVRPWIWDTMQAAHILDNRPMITSVKFQAYTKLGIVDYASHIEPYLEGKDPKNANSFNRIFDFIDKYGEDELLTYCGLDALYEYQIGAMQMDELGFSPK